MDNFVLVDVEDDDFYICELAICSNQRGKGYGTKALDQLIQLARDLDCKRVVLDADFRNDGAFRLYSSKGFKIFNRKSFGIPGKKRGMRNMELILKIAIWLLFFYFLNLFVTIQTNYPFIKKEDDY